MLRGVVAWVVLWCVIVFLLAKLRDERQARHTRQTPQVRKIQNLHQIRPVGASDTSLWLPRVLLGLAAAILATLALVVFVLIF
ncbi:MAG: hypothetical protein IPH08_06130 [Rhodocyclaceae bacterium]|nr:hypothetical protein [Rhodocyclaceae bacterium]